MDSSHTGRRRLAQGLRDLRPTDDPWSAPTLKLLQRTLPPMFFWHPHATFDFWNHHSRHKHHDLPPPPSSATPYAASVYEVSLDAEENPQELSLLRRWLAVLCISSASICVTCASSMVRHDYFSSMHDGILLNEGAVSICCGMYIYRQHSWNFPWQDDFM